ncbi:MAG: tRNA (adenosine(37)-N6)-dimethylallyltransferase MiaA [Paludibacteraceae bacterium]|nr:tRNA (adenosine(37)-N6)-dimethylallyltransferase MiaA [Paludibacteraceae bacterium]MBO5988245.1 tRNA (adenosine(37)-N6)-dimethylallyltransferase MiaA [Paludibacteraceae bacterium]
MKKTLVILLGPTGVGKTELCLSLAEELNTEIVSCDSRQFFRELKIGTAAPTEAQMQRVKHHLVGNLSIFDYYSCGRFEIDALKKLDELFQSKEVVLMTGGSMLYIDAICKGIDDIPNVDQELRDSLHERYANEGIDNILAELKLLDPEYYDMVDKKNHKRIIHALEICLTSGKTFSSFRKETAKERPFDIIKIGLNLPREELYERINRRVDIMFEEGLMEEAKTYYPHRNLNSLNTVGYKELFEYFDGNWDLDFAKNMIKQNSRRYAKKQLTWFNRDKDINWFKPDQQEEILSFLKSRLRE